MLVLLTWSEEVVSDWSTGRSNERWLHLVVAGRYLRAGAMAPGSAEGFRLTHKWKPSNRETHLPLFEPEGRGWSLPTAQVSFWLFLKYWIMGILCPVCIRV